MVGSDLPPTQTRYESLSRHWPLTILVGQTQGPPVSAMMEALTGAVSEINPGGQRDRFLYGGPHIDGNDICHGGKGRQARADLGGEVGIFDLLVLVATRRG